MATTSTIFAVIVALSNAIVAVFSYMLARHNTKTDKDAKKEQKIDKAKDKIDDACDNGSMSDLLDATKQLGDAKKKEGIMKIKLPIMLLMSILVAGCFSQKDPVIESTKPWEGHYYNVEDARKQLENAQLDKNESIWMMSNNTLKRLLKSTGQ